MQNLRVSGNILKFDIKKICFFDCWIGTVGGGGGESIVKKAINW